MTGKEVPLKWSLSFAMIDQSVNRNLADPLYPEFGAKVE